MCEGNLLSGVLTKVKRKKPVGDAIEFAGKPAGVPAGLAEKLSAVGDAGFREISLSSRKLLMDFLSMPNLSLGHPQNLSEETCKGCC